MGESINYARKKKSIELRSDKMAKKPTKKSKRKAKIAEPAFTTRKSVDIKKANNGFVVSSFDDKGEKVFIAKTKKKQSSKLTNCWGFNKVNNGFR